MRQVPVELTEASTINLPVSGVLEFDYVSTAKAPPDSVPATDAQVLLIAAAAGRCSPLLAEQRLRQTWSDTFQDRGKYKLYFLHYTHQNTQ